MLKTFLVSAAVFFLIRFLSSRLLAGNPSLSAEDLQSRFVSEIQKLIAAAMMTYGQCVSVGYRDGCVPVGKQLDGLLRLPEDITALFFDLFFEVRKMEGIGEKCGDV